MNSLVQIMSRVPPPFNMIVLIVVVTSIAGVLSSLCKQVRKYACHRHELEFKRELLDRGMPPEEIEQVLRARSTDSNS